MISCLTEQPCVLIAPGHAFPLSRAWLNHCLLQAARLSHQPCPWWPADMVIDGLVLWLEEQDWSTPFELQALQTRLGLALEGIGYPQVAAQLELTAPPLRIDLLEFALQADTLFELEFFTQLSAKLEDALDAGFQSCYFLHLDECVDALCSQSRRSNRWKNLRTELMHFLENQLQKTALSTA